MQRDGFVAYEGVHSRRPWHLAGREVEIRPVGAYMEFSYRGQVVATIGG